MSSAHRSGCTACGGKEVYTTKTNANGGYGPALLSGLGRFLDPAKMDVHVCADCGHIELFADGDTRQRLRGSGRWRKAF